LRFFSVKQPVSRYLCFKNGTEATHLIFLLHQIGVAEKEAKEIPPVFEANNDPSTPSPFSILERAPKDSPAIKMLSLWFGVLVCFFSPDVVHAEFLDRLELPNHLRQGHYQQLERIFTRQERLYRAKKFPEEHVEAAYVAFANSAADLEEPLNIWVARGEKSGTAFLARGAYFWQLGWTARGGRYMSETPDERVRGMKGNFALAWQDLKQAAQKKENSGIPYRFLISIAMNFRDEDVIQQFLEKGLQADPRSFGIRWSYLNTFRPWWRGLSNEYSIEAIEKFLAVQVTPFINDNPDLKPLLGYPDYLRGEILKKNNQDEQSLAFYEKALQHDSYYRFIFEMGKSVLLPRQGSGSSRSD
jgi:tetratricopeptide (TPR) repeat protein